MWCRKAWGHSAGASLMHQLIRLFLFSIQLSITHESYRSLSSLPLFIFQFVICYRPEDSFFKYYCYPYIILFSVAFMSRDLVDDGFRCSTLWRR